MRVVVVVEIVRYFFFYLRLGISDSCELRVVSLVMIRYAVVLPINSDLFISFLYIVGFIAYQTYWLVVNEKQGSKDAETHLSNFTFFRNLRQSADKT